MNKTVEQGISDIVGCLADPIIVFPGGWGDTLPDWLKTAITLERMMGDMKVLKGEEPTGTDTEACAYLMTLSLTNQWTATGPKSTSISLARATSDGTRVKCLLILP